MENFEVGFRINQRFNHLVAANFTIEGAGAAVILVAAFLNHRPGLALGLLLLLAGAFALFLDLGSPVKSWRSIFNAKGSWISRGTLFLGFLVVLSVLYISVPGIGSSGSGIAVKGAMGIAAVLIMLYTGFLVAAMGSIPFWNSPLLPVIFLCHALATGMAALSWVLYLSGSLKEAFMLTTAQPFLLIVILAVSMLHLLLANKKGPASKKSVAMATRGKWKTVFWGGGIGLGLLLPLFVIIIGGSWALSLVLPVVAAARIAGDYCYRLALLKTGVYESVLALSPEV
jgi:polysulfide reductase chain C